MKKIPTIFKRNPDNLKEITREHHANCEWVFNGEGVPTRKYDGTCCKVSGGVLFKRREVKCGKEPPCGFIEEQHDHVTGKRVGWLPVVDGDPQDKYHTEAFSDQPDGTYELIGPKVQGNPESVDSHVLISHAAAFVFDHCPTSYDELEQWLRLICGEGVVWHHPDGRMAKIKKRDFGIKRVV